MNKHIFLICFLACMNLAGQEKILPQWNLNKGEIHCYSLSETQNYGPNNQNLSINLDEIKNKRTKRFLESINEYENKAATANKEYKTYATFSNLGKLRFNQLRIKNTEIEQSASKKKKKKKIQQVIINEGITFQAQLNSNGSITGDYLEEKAAILTYLFTSLPSDSVRIDEKWEWDLRYLRGSYRFDPDSAYRNNKGWISGQRSIKSETLLEITYSGEEYHNGFLYPDFDGDPIYGESRVSITGSGVFNMSRSRWEELLIVIGFEQKGQTSKEQINTFHLKLVETPTDVKNQLLNRYDKGK